MPLVSFDRARRVVDGLERLSRETNLTRIEPGSVTRHAMDVMYAELHAIEDNAQAGQGEANPLSASGPYLALWADLYGVRAQVGRRAWAAASDQNVRLYVESGTFGDLNDGQPITIDPESFRIFGSSLTIRDDGLKEELPVSYRVLEPVVLAAGASEAYITIQAMQPGPDFNVAAFSLNEHNFSSYASFPNKKLLVRNELPILNGTSDGNDDSLRFELSRAFGTRDEGVAQRAVALLDALPGVSEVYFEPNYSGSGTIDFFLDAESFQIPESMLSDATTLLQTLYQSGAQFNVSSVKRIGLSITSQIRFKRGVTEEVRNAAIESVRSYLMDRILESGTGGKLDLGETARQISLTSPLIERVGDGNGFDEVIVWRDAVMGGRYGTSLLTRNTVLQAAQFERFLPEDNLIEPIQLEAV